METEERRRHDVIAQGRGRTSSFITENLFPRQANKRPVKLGQSVASTPSAIRGVPHGMIHHTTSPRAEKPPSINDEDSATLCV
ncbi:hypothetical protein J6590_052932 [Homalodisca vitripennis]|nr:hypothetical protein J6590_052932 [Homalodisca vitripennis]